MATLLNVRAVATMPSVYNERSYIQSHATVVLESL